jgi:hypothetical protein
MCSAQDDAALPAPGFPIRRSTGQRLFSASPWLIAAVHVLLRLLVPRHPPRALNILTVINRSEAASCFRAHFHSVFWPTVQFSRSGEKTPERGRGTTKGRARSLKTKQHAGLRHFQARSTFQEELTASTVNPDPNQTRPSASRKRTGCSMGSLERR